MAEIRTLLDDFDFSNPIYQAELQDILRFELTIREKLIIESRLGAKGVMLSLQDTALIFRTNPDEVIGIESKVALILTNRGVPKKT